MKERSRIKLGRTGAKQNQARKDRSPTIKNGRGPEVQRILTEDSHSLRKKLQSMAETPSDS